MDDKLIVTNSLGENIREEKYSEYDFCISESIFLLNFACKINPINISKQLGLFLRNLSDAEIEYIYPKVATQINNAMKLGYDKIIKYENAYDEKVSEIENMRNFISSGIEVDWDNIKDVFVYIYSKQMFLYGKLDEKIKNCDRSIFENTEDYSNKVAKSICSNFIVLEVRDYKYLYSIFDKYYSLNKDMVRANWGVKEFIKKFIKFINIIFLQIDSHKDDTKCNFQIIEFEDFKFDFNDFTYFYDGFYHNEYIDRNKSKKLNLIKSTFIDSYIENNNENLNNLLFIVSRLIIEDDKSHEFNYREYNLILITILELLLVNSKTENDTSGKFVKNILICLSLNEPTKDFKEEKDVVKMIYRYRSSILHGNYPGYTNAMSDLEKKLKYKPESFEYNKYNTIDYLISERLNFYISNVFEVISKNKYIIDILKN